MNYVNKRIADEKEVVADVEKEVAFKNLVADVEKEVDFKNFLADVKKEVNLDNMVAAVEKCREAIVLPQPEAPSQANLAVDHPTREIAASYIGEQ